jgi:maltose alpha-D-glucosyltransferase/alpha-amylase
LGERTAELHLALASDPDDRSFAPEPFTSHYQRSLYEALRTRKERAIQLLRAGMPKLTEAQRALAQRLLDREKAATDSLKRLMRQRVTALRIRCHGDYHLGQVLHTGSDFVIVDFEGEPDRALTERRFKRSGLSDVAGMLRSFHYAATYGLRRQARPQDVPPLAPWAELWRTWVSAAFLRAYLAKAAGAVFMPKSNDEIPMLIELYVLEKAFYEVGYELNNRPEWVDIPLQGLLQMLG